MGVSIYNPEKVEDVESHLDFSSANWRELARMLKLPEGFGIEEPGKLSCLEVLTRCATFLSQDPCFDEGTPTFEEVGGGCHFVSFGRRPGYLRDRATQLAEIALADLSRKGHTASLYFS